MLDLFRAYRARRAAVRRIAPWIGKSRYRLQAIPDEAWLQSYMIGFMGMLISLSARHAVPAIGSNATGLVQREAWAELTGCDVDIVGEEICHLSLQGDDRFTAGCRAAVTIFEASLVLDEKGETVEHPAESEAREVFRQLWAEHFEQTILR